MHHLSTVSALFVTVVLMTGCADSDSPADASSTAPASDRTTDGTGTVMGQTLESLRALDAGGGWPVPYLEEVVAELPAGVGLNVELKGPGTAAPVGLWKTLQDSTTFSGAVVLCDGVLCGWRNGQGGGVRGEGGGGGGGGTQRLK